MNLSPLLRQASLAPLRTVVFMIVAVPFLCAVLPMEGEAQEYHWRAREGLPVGSEAERYLRVLQVAGKAPLYPWTIRQITPGELKNVLPKGDDHPWHDRMEFALDTRKSFEFGLVQPEVLGIYNSAYPFGENDGALWAGKGFTGSVRAGAFLWWGPLYVRLAPEVFWAQNAEFELADNGLGGEGRFRDGRFPTRMDRPQRFGESSYSRLDLGSSLVSLSLPGITLGASGAPQHLGPAVQYPLLLGNNAGGMPHFFLQTTQPLDLWAVRVHARYFLGRMELSRIYQPQEGESGRLMVGAVATLSFRGLDGLEVGASRLVETPWPDEGIKWRQVSRPFTHVTHDFVTTENPRSENQLAVAYARWAFPGLGLELFGEILREDFARDFRFFLEEPDDLLTRSFGFQRAWTDDHHRTWVVRGEVVNSEINHWERFHRMAPSETDYPFPYPPYVHGGGGHSQNGQLLGSPAAYGGNGWTLAADRYEEAGRWTLEFSRRLQADWLWIYRNRESPPVPDVLYTLNLEVLRFSRGLEWTARITPSINLNRNVEEGNDIFNLSLSFGVRGLPW